MPANDLVRPMSVEICDRCGGGGWVPRDPEVPRSPRVPCVCQRNRARLARYEACQIPRRHAKSTFKTYQPLTVALAKVRQRAEVYTKDWLPKQPNRGLVLYGDVGRGKTHLLCAMLRELVLERGVSARFVEFSLMIAEIKSGFDRGEGYGKLMDELVNVDLLAIDELGKGRNTEFEGQVIDEVVSRRYNAERPLLATTNYSPGASGPIGLADRLGPRVFSRLRETADFIEVPGEDYRVR